nr:hypothetical protein [Tanacetum cinerariifolium]
MFPSWALWYTKWMYLYGTIEEEVYVCQPPGFEDPDYPDKVYKVVKALYGLHQAPRAWYETFANYLLENDLYKAFKKLMKDKFQMSSMGELTFFLGLQVKQKPDGIFISQDKYVAEILRKFGLTDEKLASTPIDTEKPLLKDLDGEDVDVHTYRSMIDSLMYPTSSRPDIMFVVCACAHFQVTPKASHLHAVKRIFRYLKGKPRLGLWYPKDSPFNLVAYLDSDYAGASLDRKSTTGGFQFLGCRLISWKCKKQTVVATSSTKAKYVAATNDVVRLQALIDRKKVIITEDTVCEALRLDDAESIDCLPNEDIFTKLARMGYEKPSTKLTFYKAFFSAQWKFLIHIILQCMSAKRTAWNEFSSFMASAVICLATVGDLSSYSTKYSSPVLTQKLAADDTANIAADNVDDVVAEDVVEPTPPSPIPTTTPPPPQELPSTSQVTPTLPPSPIAQPSSPLQQPQPSQTTTISMDLLNNLLETCITLTRRVENLEQDKVAQALEITKLKQRVRRLEKKKKLKVSGLKRLKKVGTAQRIESSADTEVDAAKDAKVTKEIADVQGRLEESQAQVYHIDLEHADKVLKVVTTAATIDPSTITAAPNAAIRRKEVVIRDPEKTAIPSTIIHSEPKSKDKGKGIMFEEPKPLKKQAQIEQDEAYARELEAELNKNINWDDVIEQVKEKGKQDNAVLRYQALKRKPQTEAQARKNMMVYLKNMVGFKMNYFKGMSYNDIRPIFKKYFNSNVDFLEKSKEQLEEEESRALKRQSESSEEKAAKKQKLDEEVEEIKKHLQIVPNDEDDVYTEATPLALKVPVVDYEIHTENNKPFYKIIRADRSHQLFLSFLGLLRNFDIEDLEMLWQIVQERFASSKPKNFSDDFLLTTLKAVFEKPDVKAQTYCCWYKLMLLDNAADLRLRLLEQSVDVVTTVRPRPVNTARLNSAVVNAVRVNQVNADKASACWVWRPAKPNVASITLKRYNYIDGHPQHVQEDQGYVDSGCSRHITRNMSYFYDFNEFDGGYVTFGGGANGGRITGKGTLKTGKLDFEDVYFIKELKFNLLSISQMCDKKNSVLFTDTGCFVLSPDFKLTDESQVLLKVPRRNNKYSVDMKNIVPKESLTCSLMHKKYGSVVTDDYSRYTWVFFLASRDETTGILKNFITEIENLVDKKVKVIRCDNGIEFKNSVMNDFCAMKGIRREFSIARTPQQNGVAKRRNRTLIEAARTMLADSKLPTIYWAKVVNTACYVQNRALVVKPHNKTPYELFRGRTPALSFMRPFGYHFKYLRSFRQFDGKAYEGYFVGYSMNSKAFRIYNIRTRRVEENLHIEFLENKLLLQKDSSPLFDSSPKLSDDAGSPSSVVSCDVTSCICICLKAD